MLTGCIGQSDVSCAELYVEKLASAHDSPLTHEAPPIACSTPTDSDRGWMMFTQWPDEIGFCNAWAGTWEALVDQHSRSLMGSDRIECTFNMDLTSFITGLSVDASYKLGGLKAKIPNQQATHYDHRGILCMGKLLQNGRAFSNDGSQKDNTAHLAPCPQGGMQTLTNVGTGMTIALDVETSDTFHNSKDKIQEKDNIHFGQRCLILAGKDLGKLLTFDPGGLGRMSLAVKAPVNAKYAFGTRKDEISNPGGKQAL